MTKPRVTPFGDLSEWHEFMITSREYSDAVRAGILSAFKPSYRAQGEAITPEPVQDKGVGTQPPVSEVQ